MAWPASVVARRGRLQSGGGVCALSPQSPASEAPPLEKLTVDDRPHVGVRLATRTLQSAIAGSSVGAFVGYLRSQNVGWYATTMGLNFAVFGGLYFGVREVLAAASFSDTEEVLSGTAGAVVGGVLTFAHAGPRKALPGALLWGTACVAGQLAVHAVAEWRQAEARRIVEQRSGGDPSVGARDTGTRGGGGSSDDSSPSSSHLDTPPDASASRAGAAVATLPRPQPTKWLRIERSTVDFEAARARARARDPGAANRSSDQRGEAGGEAASSSGQGWRAWLPEWLPVQRVAPGEQLQRLRGRLEEVDALVRAHQRAVELEATGETPNSEADQY